jgi:hypothetical protein
MRPDGAQGVGGKCPQLIPGHRRLPAEPVQIEAVSGAERSDPVALLVLVEVPDGPVQGLPCGPLLVDRTCFEIDASTGKRSRDPRRTGDGDLQPSPPQFAGAIDHAGGHIDGEGTAMAIEHRPGMDEIVPIAVIEREDGEGPVMLACGHAFDGFVDAHQVVAQGLDHADHRIQEARIHFQNAVRDEALLLSATGENMVEHEYCTETRGCTLEQRSCSRIVHQIEACLEERRIRHHKGSRNASKCGNLSQMA